MFKKILVPTDGSSHAAKAVLLGIDLASKYGVGLVFLSVIEGGALSAADQRLATEKGIDISALKALPDVLIVSPEGAPVVPASDHTLAASRIQAELADRLVGDAKAQAQAAGIEKVKVVARNGDPAEVILETVADEGADLIVMGSRGLGTLKGLLVGSVSQKVSHLADCSCISVKVK
ncbi:MAG: nucleotide-binding universal stress UspA family protein [Alphaproteobacteria bacterium]|jgi:nucleotide-binding universal stress UspA family protein